MTLFMKYEREHLVWNPVFTFIDHIGRHIDMSKVHKKFEVHFLKVIFLKVVDLNGYHIFSTIRYMFVCY